MADDLRYRGSVTLPRASWLYRLALVGVAAALTGLPIAYLALVAGLGWLVWWHLTTNVWLMGSVSGLFWAYLGPAAAGVAAIVLLLKPIVPLFRQDDTSIALTREQEPRLFAMLDDLSRALDVRSPTAVYADTDVNAGVAVTKGAWGPGSGYELRLGLALVAGLSARGLVGVVAHEVGHGGQKAALRLLRIAHRLDLWFERIVHGRTNWEATLQESPAMSPFTLLTSLGVWLSRHTVAGLMAAGRAIGGYALRQMEYAADQVECAVVGRDTALAALSRVNELTSGMGPARDELHAHLNDHGMLPSDLVAYLIDFVDAAPPEARRQWREHVTRHTIFDTHPSAESRASALPETAGVLEGGNTPAHLLFSDFAALCASVTRRQYQRDMGPSFAALTIVPHGQFEAAKKQRKSASEALSAFFRGCVSVQRPLRVRMPDPVLRGAERRTALRDAQREMASGAARAEPKYREYEQLSERAHTAELAEQLLSSGIDTLEEFGERTAADARATREWARGGQAEIAPALGGFEAAAALRLTGAVPDDAPDDALEVRLLAALDHAAAALPNALFIASRAAIREELVHRLGARLEDPVRRLAGVDAEIAAAARRIGETLGSIANPVAPGATLAASCGLDTGRAEPPQTVAQLVVNAYVELLAAVAGAALAAEASWTAPETAPFQRTSEADASNRPV